MPPQSWSWVLRRLGSDSCAEQRAYANTHFSAELRRRLFLSLRILEPEHFNLPALRTDAEAPIANRRDRTDVAGRLRKPAQDMLAHIEQLQLLTVQQRPGARCGVAAANEVEDDVDVIVPIDARFRRSAPALVACMGVVLRSRRGAAPRHQFGRLQQRRNAHRK